jgi:hypothetical protein
MRSVLFAVAFAVAVIVTNIGSAEQLGTKDGLEGALKAVDKERAEFMRKARPVDAGSKKVAKQTADAAAQYYLFRITIRSLDSHAVQNKFAVDVLEVTKQSDRSFVNIFGPSLVASMKDVLAAQNMKKDAAIIVNAAMMLPTMAKLKQDDVGTYLRDLVDDPKTHDVVRLYALKGLKEYMPIGAQLDDNNLDIADARQNARRKLDTLYVETLTKFIERKPSVAGLSPGEVDAVRYLRREAIISLGFANSPTVIAVTKKQVKKDILEGTVAPTLLNVLAKGQLEPTPSLQEKLEAVHGLCALKFANLPEYNPDVANYLIGQTVLEFTKEYNVDWVNFAAAGVTKKLPYIAWKLEAKRLEASLKELEKNTKTKAAKELHDLAAPVLAPMSKYDPLDPGRMGDFSRQVPQWRPSDGKVFRTLNGPVIPLN